MYYLNSRYYNPEWGRFINADKVVDNKDILGVNLYSYCGNNPVNRVDITGHGWITALIELTAISIKAVETICSVFSPKKYTNTATKNEDGSYNASTTINKRTYDYKINKKGSISFDFAKKSTI